ncbi:twin-arginine translocation signal domain-containing protein [Paenibacillus sp. p3-SID867]|uniref:Acg family FMN-binding oxidoreductase n=1 Tax=Paenibacillus sp. p3-SID867 TaxID=2916363 RepID=UPI0021A3FF92|nr:twin-arginine translocation signal domain-containing protein [Paenibacillus sp. p3-SID867]MCT1399297.1 twin-arginine translocation signal domain-containing protein [Paenibacillus sp. p3-SID867]
MKKIGKEPGLADKLMTSKSSRRDFLKKAGASLLAVSFGGLLWRAVDQGVFSTGKGPAYELWTPDEVFPLSEPMALVHAATLASNPHNSQPWLFRVTETSIELFADLTRSLGTMDPLLREMHMGLGCALENLMLTARVKGYLPQLIYFPDPLNTEYIAKVELIPGKKDNSDLHQAITERHTHRGAYDTDREISSETFEQISEIGYDEPNVRLTWLTTADQKGRAGDLVIESTVAIIADPEMSHDSNRWFRGDWDELHKFRDGLTLDAQGGPAWVRAAGKILPNVSHDSANQFWLKSTRQTHVHTAAAYGLLSIPDLRNPADQVRAGRFWQRIHLKGTAEGLALHPLNQPMEMRDRELQLKSERRPFGQQLAQLSDSSAGEAVFLFRIGYPMAAVYPSPRRDLKDIIMK